MTDAPMIRVTDLVKRFGQSVAVDHVSFEVARGEVVGFLGPNGAGKTTTIRVLTCYHPATSGVAEVAGFDVQRAPVEVRRNIGYLPENVPIYPDLRVEEYLRYRAELKGVPRKQRRAAVGSAMERAGVVEVRRKLVAHVSRGYRQRVGLADALVAQPPILILDEPTSGLDPNQRRRMRALIRELSEQHTILFSSHILSEVADVSSRIMIIANGVLRADGTIDELLATAPGRQLTVSARAAADELADLVTAAVDSPVASADDDGDGWATVRLDLDADADPRVAVSESLHSAGVQLRQLQLELPTLERYFAHVTEHAAASAAEAEVA